MNRMQYKQMNHGVYGNGGGKIKKKSGNAFAHLENFTAVQQLSLFAPEIEIELERLETNSPLFKASATFRGELTSAIQQGKKKAKQAICSKIIRVSRSLNI